jgi:hypothetical protein
MRANREDTPVVQERRAGNYSMLVAGASLFLLALLLYIGLSDSDTPATEPVPLPVVRDSAIVAPPVVDTPATQPQTANATARGNFSERQLAPPTSTVGAGTAPVTEQVSEDALVIDGPLLEELEEEAQTETPAAN